GSRFIFHVLNSAIAGCARLKSISQVGILRLEYSDIENIACELNRANDNCDDARGQQHSLAAPCYFFSQRDFFATTWFVRFRTSMFFGMWAGGVGGAAGRHNEARLRA